MQTASRDTAPSENFGVLRLRRKIFNENSTIGAMVTNRVTTHGDLNVAAGVDAVIRPFGEEYLTLKWVQTYTTGLPNPAVDWDQSRMLLRLEPRNLAGFSYAGELVRSGSEYDPGMGFNFRSDFTSLAVRPAFRWLLGPRTPFRSVTVAGGVQGYRRNQDHTIESGELVPELGTELKSGETITLAFRNSYESIRDAFEISGGATIEPGNYWFRQAELMLMASRSASFRPTFMVNAGTFFDGSRIGVSLRPAWNPSRFIELGVDYDYNRVRFTDRAQRLDLHVVRLRVQTALNVHLSLATLMQYDNADDAIGINARLRYNFREGRDLWVVFNEALNTDRPFLVTPRLPLSRSRAVMLKYTHTIGL